jgi:hypothetical protein
MSHKGSWSRVKDHKAWHESPLWNKKKPQSLIEILGEYPSEMLTYEQGFDLDQYDLPLETYFKSIEEIQLEAITSDLKELADNTNPPRIFLITNNQDHTCKVAVWMEGVV